MKPLIRAEISASALRTNLLHMRRRAPHSKVVAVIKANAYGHGAAAVAGILGDAGADMFGVARLDEAVALREAGVANPVLLLEGVVGMEQLIEAARHDLEVVIHEEGQLLALERFPGKHRFTAWLKVDTGMNRLGFRPSDTEAALRRLEALGERLRGLRVMTHFAAADELHSRQTRDQLTRFDVLTGGWWHPRSMANSAAIFSVPESHGDWIRPGLALYGVSPFPDQVGESMHLAPVMRLVSTVIAVRRVPFGETVGYGGIWRAPRDSRVAIVAAGYADGLPRLLPNGTPVMVGGRKGELVGRVSMDMIAVDVTHLPPVQVGTPAIIWGPELPVEEIAAHAGTMAYELLCAVAPRVPRVMAD